MPDRRQVLRALLLGAAGLAVPASCGLPSGGHPVLDGPGPAPGGSGDSLPKAPTPADASDPVGLVTNFFAAVAGRIRSDADLSAANDRARKFLTAAARSAWPAAAGGITVVRIEPRFDTAFDEHGSTHVTVTLRPSGVLGTDGTVGPPPSRSTRKLTFEVVQTPDSGRTFGYLINGITVEGEALSGMLLDSAQLDGKSFSPQLIYFWSTDRTGLAPDLRYVPAAGVSREIQYTDVVDWVLAGPSQFLHDTVPTNPYDGNSVVLPNLAAPDKDGLLVNLANQPPRGFNPAQIVAQLRWSLRGVYQGAVRLQINSQPVQAELSPGDFRAYNLADKDNRSEDSAGYCVATGGVVRPLSNPTNLPAVLNDAEVNKDVLLAALSRDLNYAALVKKTDKQAKQLWIVAGTGSGKPTPILVTQAGGQPLQGQVWSRPAFLPQTNNRLLVAVDGRLYLVKVPDGQAVPQSNMSVSTFAVAPDGRRIAVISDGTASVSSLQVANDVVTLGSQPRVIDVGLTECSAIAWSKLERVLVGGRLPGTDTFSLVEATIDGAIANEWAKPFTTQIVSVAALPAPASAPTNYPETALMSVVNGANRVGPSSNVPLTFTGSDLPSPSPSAGATGGPGTPTYPFYVD